jgi:hypothetical protein
LGQGSGLASIGSWEIGQDRDKVKGDDAQLRGSGLGGNRVSLMTQDLEDTDQLELGIETEDTSNSDLSIEPFDPSNFRVENRIMSLDTVIERIRLGEINLSPAFQRKAGIWTDQAQSRLIESILLRIPLPAFYIDATDEERWVVIDGLQRLAALRRYVVSEELRLDGVEFLKDLKGTTYSQLPRTFQRRINETQITVYLIEKGTPEDVKFNIFKRINTGGLPLSLQEIRHALNQGAAADLLKTLAESHEFKRATNFSLRDDRMADRECILRYFAFKMTPPSEYKVKDLDEFLNRAMNALGRMDDPTRKSFADDFIRTMDRCHTLLDRSAFRKPVQDGKWGPINKALFEAWSVNISNVSDCEFDQLLNRKADLIDAFVALLTDKEFERSVSLGTGEPRKVKARFAYIEELLMNASRLDTE